MARNPAFALAAARVWTDPSVVMASSNERSSLSTEGVSDALSDEYALADARVQVATVSAGVVDLQLRFADLNKCDQTSMSGWR